MLIEQTIWLRAFRTLTLAAGVLLFCGSSWAQISLVHVTACNAPAATCTVPSTGSGNLLVVGWASGSGGGATTIASITDNAGNPYAECSGSRAVDANMNEMGDVWYAKNSVSGATTLTITTNPAGASGSAVIWEFSGAETSSPLDQAVALDSQPATTTPSGASITASVSKELIVSMAWGQGTVSSILSGNAFANDSLASGGGWAHYVPSSPGTYHAQWNSNLGSYASSAVAFRGAAAGGSACDLNSDGSVNVVDVQLAVNMDLGLRSCPSDLDGGVCNSALVQQIVNAALGEGCSASISHSVSLSWTASSSPSIAGYNVYRSATSGTSYTKLNGSLLTAMSLTDGSVAAGQTYYYVATAVDTSGNESAYSNQTQANIPTP
jgi:hypothetical protein